MAARTPHHSPQPFAASPQPLASTSRSPHPTPPRPGKRKRTPDENMAATPAVVVFTPYVLPGVTPYDDRASPAPTEIIEPEATGEEVTRATIAAGVKVVDFAFERRRRPDIRAPEVWPSALQALVAFDQYVRTPTRSDTRRLPAKQLYNLLNAGWISQEEAERYWTQEDWDGVRAYVRRAQGPYPCTVCGKKPTRAYRRRLLEKAYTPSKGDRPESEVWMPEDEPGMDDGPPVPEDALPDTAILGPKVCSAGTAVVVSEEMLDSSGRVTLTPLVGDVPAHKRRRASVPEVPTTATATRSITPEVVPEGLTPTSSARPLSRSTSSTPRSHTPPTEEPRLQPRRRGLARTQTLARIPVQ